MKQLKMNGTDSSESTRIDILVVSKQETKFITSSRISVNAPPSGTAIEGRTLLLHSLLSRYRRTGYTIYVLKSLAID